jgi:hypothetical protein
MERKPGTGYHRLVASLGEPVGTWEGRAQGEQEPRPARDVIDRASRNERAASHKGN